jgi:hypothetical protein
MKGLGRPALMLVCILLVVSPETRAEDALDDLPQRVARAIDSASAWLEARVRPDGSFAEVGQSAPKGRVALGEDLLAGWALLHGREGKRCISAQRSLSRIKEGWAAEPSTYGVALALAFLAELSRQRGLGERQAWAREAVLERAEPAWAREHAGRMVRSLSQWRGKKGLWGYGSGYSATAGDISNTQFALLGWLCASRLGVSVPRTEIPEITDQVMALQWEKGPVVNLKVASEPRGDGYGVDVRLSSGDGKARPFSYRSRQGTRASTTLGALFGLGATLTLSEARTLGEDGWKQGVMDAVRDGAAWVQLNFTVSGNPSIEGDDEATGTSPQLEREQRVTLGDPTWLGYYLLSLEQFCSTWKITRLGEADWYESGAEYLLGRQAKDGSWSLGALGVRGDVVVSGAPDLGTGHTHRKQLVDTALGLLFLKRATARTVRGRDEPTRPVTPSSGSR